MGSGIFPCRLHDIVLVTIPIVPENPVYSARGSMQISGNERILVTGATGFSGSATTALLRSKGYDVVAHARKAAPGIDWVADLGNLSAPGCAFPTDVTAVVHCAGANPSRSDAFARDNTCATVALAALLETAGSLRRVVHLSSVAVYKRPPSGNWIISENAETVDVNDPGTDPHAHSKRASELALDALAHRRPDIKVTHLRASSIYGPGMVVNRLLPVFLAQARRHEPLRLYGPRGHVQNFIHVQDVADLEMALVFDDGSPHVVNAFSDDTYGLMALAALIKTGLRSRSQVVDAADDAAAPEAIFVNTRAKRFHPRFRSLADHLLDTA
jgi:nucleoside-diphosphate-sugar epimerase